LRRPAGASRRWARAGEGDQIRFLFAIEPTRATPPGALGQCPGDAAFDEALPGAVDGRAPHVQGLRDLFVSGIFGGAQENVGPNELARRRLPFLDHLKEAGSFFLRHVNDKLLGHVPSQREHQTTCQIGTCQNSCGEPLVLHSSKAVNKAPT
jgi:hypothetical protein